MPIWSEILAELAATAEPEKPPDFDYVRRKYIVQLYEHSKRNTIDNVLNFSQIRKGGGISS